MKIFLGAILFFFSCFAHATITWSLPVSLSAAGGDALGPEISSNSAGDIVIAWERNNGANYIIQAVDKPNGSSFGTVTSISAAGQDGLGPAVNLASSGNAVLVWDRSNGANTIIQASNFTAGGAWSSVSDLSAVGQNANFQQVAVDTSGNATAIWARSNGTHNVIQAATQPSGGAWGVVTNVSDSAQNAAQPQIVVDSSGNVTAIWNRFDGAKTIIQSAGKPFGGAWGAVTDLSAAGQDATEPQLAVDGSGNITAVWKRSNGTNIIIQTANLPFSGAWSLVTDLSAAGQDADKPEIAVDSAGNATVVWIRSNGTNNIAQATYLPFGGSTWATPVNLSTTGQNASFPFVAVDSLGNAVAAWSEVISGVSTIQTANKPLGWLWSSTTNLSTAGEDSFTSVIGFDGSNNAYVVWTGSNGSNFIIQYALGTPTTSTGSWNGPVNLSESGRDAFQPIIIADSSSNVLAGWSRSNGSNFVVQASYLASGGNWPPPTSLTTAGEDSPGFEAAFDGAGNATAIWEKGIGTNDVLQSAFLASGGSWTSPVNVSGVGVGGGHIGVAAAGAAYAIWNTKAINNSIQTATSSSPGGAWGPITTLDTTSGDTSDITPQIVIDAFGNAIAVWQGSNGVNTTIESANKPVADVWSGVTTISTAGEDASLPAVAAFSSGNGIAVWKRSNGTNFIIQSSIFSIGSHTWATPVNISAAGEDATTPQVAIDAQGNAFAIWVRSNGTNDIVQSSELLLGGTWSTPVNVSAAGEDAENPQLSIDSSGDVFATWDRSNGSNTIVQASIKLTGRSWSTPVNLSASGENAIQSDIVVNSSGAAFAVWERTDGSNFIIQSSANGASPSGPSFSPIAPSGLSAQKRANNFGVFKDLVAHLTWQASPSDNTVGYFVFRDGELIGTTGSSELFFDDHNRKKNQIITYTVTAFGSSGAQSSAATLIWSY